MKLSVIMPVYNEESTVLEAIKRVENAVIPGVEKELIIVDDGSKDKTMKVLLTGATGFIGKQLVNDLKANNIDFKCLLRRTFINEALAKKLSLNVIYGALEDITALSAATYQIDIVIHLAAMLHTSDKTDLKIANVDGTNNLLKACKQNNVKKFIFISSYLAMPQFSDYYGVTKKQGEELVKSSGLEYVILRPTMVYGRNDYYLSMISSIIKKHKLVPLPNFNLQPVHVSDVSKAIISSLNQEIKNKEYFLAGQDMIDFNTFANMIASHLSLERKTVAVPFWMAKPALFFYQRFNDSLSVSQLNDLKKFSSIDISAAKTDLKFDPVSVEQGLKLSL